MGWNHRWGDRCWSAVAPLPQLEQLWSVNTPAPTNTNGTRKLTRNIIENLAQPLAMEMDEFHQREPLSAMRRLENSGSGF